MQYKHEGRRSLKTAGPGVRFCRRTTKPDPLQTLSISITLSSQKPPMHLFYLVLQVAFQVTNSLNFRDLISKNVLLSLGAIN